MAGLQETYKKEIAKKLQKDLGIKNPMAVPKLAKITVNMGVKDAVADKKNIEYAVSVMEQITGQKVKVVRAKKSISSFKLRQGDKIGAMVTLRGDRMYNFFEKLISIVLPRIRDFRGVKRTSFDGRGNYSLGFSEYIVFPEIDPGKVERMMGMEVTITTTARTNEEGYALLESLGMPFQKGGKD